MCGHVLIELCSFENNEILLILCINMHKYEMCYLGVIMIWRYSCCN